MRWRVAPSLLTLRDQVNRMAPDRDKSSDGTIGDERHQTTKSEHNPDANGVVRAMDITHDPAHGVDARKLAEALVASRDTRILYLISNAQIVSSVVNPHRHHMHISVVPEPHRYDDIRPWDLSALELKEDADATSPQTPDASSVPASAGRIIATVRVSDVPNLIWSDRGRAPSGYAKGMAVAFARVYAKWKIGNSAALVMAAANSGDDTRDALSWYNSRFQPKAMDNGKAGADTLRHLFVLLFGLGMRESSGRYCEGRDRSARNISADSAEAGLFQMSWDAHTADAEILQLFGEYRASQDDGLLAIFCEGVTAHQYDLESYG